VLSRKIARTARENNIIADVRPRLRQGQGAWLSAKLAAVLRNLPASVLLGTVMGFLLPRIRDQRALCYSVLIWPIARYAWYLIYTDAQFF
jgi:hypothetical protein